MRVRISTLVATMLIGCLFAATSCGDCAGVGSPAVDVTIRDAETGVGAASGATLYLFKQPASQPIEIVVGADSLHVFAGFDESGTFDVVLEKPGYYPWTAEGIRVVEDCGTQTAFL